VAAAALVIGGAGWVVAWSGLGVSVQLASPRWVVGRSMSIYLACTYGGIAGGSWLWGVVAENYSLAIALGGSAGALLLVTAIGVVMPIRGAEEADLDPVESFDVPKLAHDLKPRSGPIVVRIEYSIPQENLQTFLGFMLERRRVQSRAGARNWNLQRDLQNPSRWIETFRTPTWTDYLRLNHRLTASDQKLDEHLSSLHAHEIPPQLSLSIERPPTPVREVGLPATFVSHP
jgi:hypothetical protein